MKTRGSRSDARFAEPAVAIHEQRAGDLRHAEVQERKDEELIPEDVALIGLTRPAARRNTDIEPDRIRRYGLEQMKGVQTQQHRHIQLGTGGLRPKVNIEPTPEPAPCPYVHRQG